MPKKHRDTANWEGVSLVSMDVGAGNKPRRLIHDGYQYATEGEWRLAKLLSSHAIPFTPDVKFTLTLDDGRPRMFVPDFIFNAQPYVWTARGRQKIIHGIEAKGKTRNGTFSEKARENVRLLQEQRGIVVLLLSNAQIKQYFNKNKLPLHPLHGG